MVKAFVLQTMAVKADPGELVTDLRCVTAHQFPMDSDPTRHALLPYAAKRNFNATPEPSTSGPVDGPGLGQRSFVVQKHWASHLHYDFRLELHGTMKSWAVPKGPSLDPKDKRMAVQVEDHPLSYASFEGTIPPKQYGAGKVIVWDRGFWQPLGDPDADYLAGNLKFELRGHKLHGKWALIRIKGKGDAKSDSKGEKQPPWLLIKEKDGFAQPASAFSVVDALPDSVMEKVLPEKPKAGEPRRAGARPPARAPSRTAADLPAGARKSALPATLAPQLATLAEGLPDNPLEWIFEVKFDGYRLMARVDGAHAKDIQLFTRNGNDWTSKLASLQQAIASLNLPSGWYDGEIAVPDKKGIPDFGALQACFESRRTDDIVLYLFDVPYLHGHDLRACPLEARRAALKRVLAAASPDGLSDRVRFSEEFNADARSLLASACKLGLEGLIAKRRDSTYASRRASSWVKLKCQQRQEFAIGGYTDPQGARTGFGALLLGVYDANGALQYAGNVGTGFNERTLADIKKKLDTVAQANNPFSAASAIEGRPHWVKPTLVAEVAFGEWTSAGRIRHAVFRGLRTDKDASLIVREQAMKIAPAGKARSAAKQSVALPTELRVTHPDRVIDASTGTTKMDLLRYYALVGDLMMEHLKGRPVSIVRAPAGVGGELFFQKHLDGASLAGIRAFDSGAQADTPALMQVTGKQGLLSAAQWNMVEIHTVNGTRPSLAHPDRMVFDLDPGEGVPWLQVQQAAQLVHAFLVQLGLQAFLKTSGGKGLHVVVPVKKVHDWEAVKGFSQAIVLHLAATIPQRFVAKSGPKNRVGKIYVDYLRNGPAATTVCAWSARARPGMGISVPVDWRELDSLRGADHWTVRSVHQRLDQGNAPWSGYKAAAQSLSGAMKTLNYTPPTQT